MHRSRAKMGNGHLVLFITSMKLQSVCIWVSGQLVAVWINAETVGVPPLYVSHALGMHESTAWTEHILCDPFSRRKQMRNNRIFPVTFW